MEADTLKSVYTSLAIYITYQFSHIYFHTQGYSCILQEQITWTVSCRASDMITEQLIFACQSNLEALNNHQVGYNNSLLCLVYSVEVTAC